MNERFHRNILVPCSESSDIYFYWQSFFSGGASMARWGETTRESFSIFQTLCLEFFIPHCHRWIFLIPPLKVNDKNFPFFNACHGIFLNYCWKTGGTNEKVTLSFFMGLKLWEGVNTFYTIDTIKKWHRAIFRNKNFFPIPITLSEIPYTKKKLFPDWTFPKSIW